MGPFSLTRSCLIREEWQAFGQLNIVAVCDVDERRASETIIRKHKSFTATNDAGFKRFPKARRYNDFRKLFDWEEKHIDAAWLPRPTICTSPPA